MQNMKISNKEKVRLEKIAIQNNVKGGYATLKEVFDEKAKELQDRGIEENLDRFAVNAVLNEFRRVKQRQMSTQRTSRVKPIAIYGFIAGDMGLRDLAAEMRRKAKNYSNKEGIQAALDAQLINGDNEVLDTREMVYGKANPKYLEPLNPRLKLRKRTIFGFFRKNGEKTFKITFIQSNDNKITKSWDSIKKFTPCQTFGILKEDSKTDMRLNSSQAEGTTTVFKALKEGWNINTILEATVKPELCKIQKIEKHYETFKDAWDRRVFLRGVIGWLTTDPDRLRPWQSAKFTLMDPNDEEATVNVELPVHIPVDFGELSEVYVFGRTRRIKYRDDDNKLVEGAVAVNGFGVYPIPGLTTPKEETGEETLEDEDEIEGWLE